ncbi:Gypsy retrotransposon integrase-like protein 1 [Cryptotrichosporon argae]
MDHHQDYLAGLHGVHSTGMSVADAEAEAKRRRVMRACDVCRRKKIRCEGPMTSNAKSKCAHCQEYSLDCTYVEAAKRRGPPKGFVDALEQRCSRLENIILQLRPDIDIAAYAGPVLDRDDFDQAAYAAELRDLRIPVLPLVKPLQSHVSSASPAGPSTSSTPPTGATASVSILGPQPWRAFEQAEPGSPTVEETSLLMTDSMSQLHVSEGTSRFYGRASGKQLFDAVTHKRASIAGGAADQSSHFLVRLAQNRRPAYWQPRPWEQDLTAEGLRPLDHSVWPEPKLAERLIDAYFQHVNVHTPLLNNVIFRKQYASRLYDSHHEFAQVCLLVFANGARFVDDERVYWTPGDSACPPDVSIDESGDAAAPREQSAGWRYFLASLRMGRVYLAGPTLWSLQNAVLSCTMLRGNAEQHYPWFLAGSALRSAQEVGVHVRTTMVKGHRVERALFNRAFWCLYHMDRVNCAAIGRGMAISDTDFDTEYPVAVDDEFWETGNPETDFKQPEAAGMAMVTPFIQLLKLDHVLGAALRTIYAVKQTPDSQPDSVPNRAVVAELDSALTAWQDGLPDGLRWDPDRADVTMLLQSAICQSHYYYIQILIHRTFIPTPLPPTDADSVSAPSLAICLHAARSICNILRIVMARRTKAGIPRGTRAHIDLIVAVVTAVVIILANLFAGRQDGEDRARSLRDIQDVIEGFGDLEITHRQVGKMGDLIRQLGRDAEKEVERASASEGPNRRRPRADNVEGDVSTDRGVDRRLSGTAMPNPARMQSRSAAPGGAALAGNAGCVFAYQASPASADFGALGGHGDDAAPVTGGLPSSGVPPSEAGGVSLSIDAHASTPQPFDAHPLFAPAAADMAAMTGGPGSSAFHSMMLGLMSGHEFRPPDALATSLFGTPHAGAPQPASPFPPLDGYTPSASATGPFGPGPKHAYGAATLMPFLGHAGVAGASTFAAHGPPHAAMAPPTSLLGQFSQPAYTSPGGPRGSQRAAGGAPDGAEPTAPPFAPSNSGPYTVPGQAWSPPAWWMQ